MLERIKYILIILLIPLAIFADGQTTYHAKRIRVDTTNFDNNLSSADNTVQKALETLDEVTGGGGVSNHNDLNGLQGGTTDEYYHLTQTVYDNVTNKLTIDDTNKNVFLGTSVFAHDSGDYNVGIGYMAGYNNDTTNSTGIYNVYIGYKAGYGATYGNYNNGKYNIGFGYVPLYYNTTGMSNIAIGAYACFKNSCGSANIGICDHTLYSNTSGAHNIAIGQYSGYYLNGGNFNIMLGEFTGYGSSGSNYSYNIFIGDEAGRNTTTGHSNIFIGYAAGDNITEGHNNILIGPNLDLPSPTTNNYMNIGDLLIGNLDTNKLGIGTSSLPVETLEVNGGIKIGTSTNTNTGTIRWTGADFEGYTAAGWKSFTQLDKIDEGNSSVEVIDSGTGEVSVKIDGTEVANFKSDSIKLMPNASGNVELFSDTEDNPSLCHYGRITAAGTSKYISWQLDDTDDKYHLRREDDYVQGFKIEMPVNITNELTMQGGIVIDLVDKPSSAPTLTLLEEAGNVDAGTHYYRISFITDEGETGPSPAASITTDATHGKVQITLPISSDSRVVGRKIYRSVAGGGGWQTYELATINDNTTTTYIDNIADADLGSVNGYFRNNTTVKQIYLDDAPAFFVGRGGEPNTLLGLQAGKKIADGTAESAGANVYIGSGAGYNTNTGRKNVGIGLSALRSLESGGGNVGIGWRALYYLTTAQTNIAIGREAGENCNGSLNVIIGNYAAEGSSADRDFRGNVVIGTGACNSIEGGDYNIAIGYHAGDNITSGSYNILIGYNIDAQSPTSSNTLSIGNLIFGTDIDGTGTTVSSGNIGIATPTPTAKLDINSSTGYNQLRMRKSYTPTSTSDSNGNVGDIAWDDNYIYIKTSAGWKRAALSTF